jgi:plastocyanin
MVILSAALSGCGGDRTSVPEDGKFSGPSSAFEEKPRGVFSPRVSYKALDVVPHAGSISGVVTVTGPVPKLQPRPVDKDKSACGHGDKPPLALVLGPDKGIANAVVVLKGVAAGKKFAPAAPVLDQKNCDYVPYVQVVAAGAKVAILNSDPVSHNVRASDASGASLFNLGMPLQGQRTEQTLEAPGPVKIKCDVHPWMFAWIWVADSPYAVLTGKDGRFTLADVPPGTYVLSVWHELFGTKESPVTVPPQGTATVNVALSLLDAGS